MTDSWMQDALKKYPAPEDLKPEFLFFYTLGVVMQALSERGIEEPGKAVMRWAAETSRGNYEAAARDFGF